MNKFFIWLLIGLVLAVILFIIYRKNFKRVNVPCVCLMTGAPKTGKSLLSTKLAYKEYKKRHRVWRVVNFFHKCEEPLFYTNVKFTFGNFKRKHYIRSKTNFKYPDMLKLDLTKNKYFYYHKLDRNIRVITKQLYLRQERFNYKSIILIQESSLLSDNMDCANQERNAEMSLFYKLIGHMTKGGKMYVDTQNTLDNHYSLKRVCASFFFIQKSINLFFFRILYIREMISNDLGQNNFIDDVDTTTRKVLVLRTFYHRYDRYEFSYLTDDLNKSNSQFKEKNGLISFNPLYERLADKRKGGSL